MIGLEAGYVIRLTYVIVKDVHDSHKKPVAIFRIVQFVNKELNRNTQRRGEDYITPHIETVLFLRQSMLY